MRTNTHSPWLAAILSFLTIGLGHIYIGAGGRGILLFCVSYTVSYLAILSGSLDQLGISLALIVVIGICCYAYTIIDVLKLLPHMSEQPRKVYSRWYVYFLIYLINSIFFSPILSTTFMDSLGKAYAIADISMSPTLVAGDHILIEQNPEKALEHGDIVTFTLPGQPETTYVKRVAGVAGDTIEINNGQFFINGKKVAERNLRISPPPFERIIPHNSFFVLGDNTENSFDSRSFGLLKKQQVNGLARKIYWSWNGETSSVRWERLGATLSKMKDEQNR